MLSSDILTEFKDRGEEIRVNPLTFSEFYSAVGGDKRESWKEYYTCSGMPLVLSKKTHQEKSQSKSDYHHAVRHGIIAFALYFLHSLF